MYLIDTQTGSGIFVSLFTESVNLSLGDIDPRMCPSAGHWPENMPPEEKPGIRGFVGI